MLKPHVVKRRPTGPVLPAHVAEARRRLGPRAASLTDDQLCRALWVARALPAALDVLADTRAAPGLATASLSSAEVYAGPCAPGPLLAIAALVEDGLLTDGRQLQVRFLRAGDAGAPSLALVVWHLSAKVGGDAGPPVIHRFVHGPRR